MKMNLSRWLPSSLTLLLCTFLSLPGGALAAVCKVISTVGTVTVQKSDGTVQRLGPKSQLDAGDTVSTEKDSYAQLNFPDASLLTVRPNSKLKIEAFTFKQKEPANDNAIFRLIIGGMRTVSGLIGKRGNEHAYEIRTSTATMGIRGTAGDTFECSQGCPGVTPTSDGLPPGTYHRTSEGTWTMTNNAGSQVITTGQIGYARDGNTAPVLMPPGFNLDLPALPPGLDARPCDR